MWLPPYADVSSIFKCLRTRNSINEHYNVLVKCKILASIQNKSFKVIVVHKFFGMHNLYLSFLIIR